MAPAAPPNVGSHTTLQSTNSPTVVANTKIIHFWRIAWQAGKAALVSHYFREQDLFSEGHTKPALSFVFPGAPGQMVDQVGPSK